MRFLLRFWCWSPVMRLALCVGGCSICPCCRWFSLFLAGVLCSYFVCYWCLQGRTPGMHLARLRVQNTDGSPLRISQALIRLGTSAFGLGNVMVIFDSHDVMAFQDYWAKCEVIKAR